MIRRHMIGLVSLSLAACGRPYTPIKPIPTPPDLPDAALVQPCDTTETDPATNVALVTELAHTRRQRDDCAAQVGGLRTWRTDASARADKAQAAAQPAATPAPAGK